jgi:hypothetical protein
MIKNKLYFYGIMSVLWVLCCANAQAYIVSPSEYKQIYMQAVVVSDTLMLKQNDDINHCLKCSVQQNCLPDTAGQLLTDMSPSHHLAVQQLLFGLLKPNLYKTFLSIMQREDFAYELEKNYNQDKSHFSVPTGDGWTPMAYTRVQRYRVGFYGKPSLNTPWYVVIEGHHVMMRLLITPQKSGGATVDVVPFFIGSYPLRVPNVKDASVMLNAHQDEVFLWSPLQKAKKMIRGLSPIQQKTAGHQMPFDVADENKQSMTEFFKNPFLNIKDLNAVQQKTLSDFLHDLHEYYPIPLSDFKTGFFSYAGDFTHQDKPFYWRFYNDDIIFEMLQTRDFSLNPTDFKTANHLHIIMRSRIGCDYPDVATTPEQSIPVQIPSKFMQWILEFVNLFRHNPD